MTWHLLAIVIATPTPRVVVPASITCERLPPPENGQVLGPASQQGWQVGQRLLFNCLPGYNLIGEEDVTCQADGNFDGVVPFCERKKYIVGWDKISGLIYYLRKCFKLEVIYLTKIKFVYLNEYSVVSQSLPSNWGKILHDLNLTIALTEARKWVCSMTWMNRRFRPKPIFYSCSFSYRCNTSCNVCPTSVTSQWNYHQPSAYVERRRCCQLCLQPESTASRKRISNLPWNRCLF